MKPRRKRTTELLRLDRAHLWHPFTQMACWQEEEQVIVERGAGCTLVDTDGNRYLDGVSSLWCNVHGHRAGPIDRAVRRQLGRVAHSTLLGLASPPSIRLAALLARLAPPGLTRVFFSDDGATAVEAALKIAVQYQAQRGRPGKTAVAALALAYHGDTIGAVSLGGVERFHALFSPLCFEAVRIPAPYCYRCPFGLAPGGCGLRCADEAERIVRSQAPRLAALVMEPLVQGAAGMIVHPAGYLSRVRRACAESGVLFVADEVAVGLGRTGRLFACEEEGVAPDILCLAKGLTGGYLPVAATLTTQEVYEAFLGAHDSGRAFLHGHTYTGNALGCAAAVESLRLLARRVLPALPAKAARMARLVGERVAPLPHVGDARVKGLMAGIELVRERATKEPWPAAARMGHRVALEARRRGVLLRPLGDVIVLMPPLAVREAEIDLLVGTAARAIEAATGAAE